MLQDFKEEWDIFCCRQQSYEIRKARPISDVSMLASKMEEVRVNVLEQGEPGLTSSAAYLAADSSRLQNEFTGGAGPSSLSQSQSNIHDYNNCAKLLCYERSQNVEVVNSKYSCNGQIHSNGDKNLGHRAKPGTFKVSIILPEEGSNEDVLIEEVIEYTQGDDMPSCEKPQRTDSSTTLPLSLAQSRMESLAEFEKVQETNFGTPDTLQVLDKVSLETVECDSISGDEGIHTQNLPSPSSSQFNNPCQESSQNKHNPLCFSNSLPNGSQTSVQNFYTGSVYYTFYE